MAHALLEEYLAVVWLVTAQCFCPEDFPVIENFTTLPLTVPK